MGRRALLTLQAIEHARERGERELRIAHDTIVTPAARDACRRLGLRLVTARAPGRVRRVYGNWKAALGLARARALLEALCTALPLGDAALEVALFPSTLHLGALVSLRAERPFRLGAQDLDPVEPGAHTGATPPAALRELGVELALVGHSERRARFGDDLARVRAKLRAGLEAGLEVVLCVGESLEERDAGRTFSVLRHQLLDALGSLGPEHAGALVCAYEPVWAIGSGLVPTRTEIEDALGSLRDHLIRRWGDAAGARVSLLYGGSVGPQNAEALFSIPLLDGLLVGGASLDADRFAAIVRAALTVAAETR